MAHRRTHLHARPQQAAQPHAAPQRRALLRRDEQAAAQTHAACCRGKQQAASTLPHAFARNAPGSATGQRMPLAPSVLALIAYWLGSRMAQVAAESASCTSARLSCWPPGWRLVADGLRRLGEAEAPGEPAKQGRGWQG